MPEQEAAPVQLPANQAKNRSATMLLWVLVLLILLGVATWVTLHYRRAAQSVPAPQSSAASPSPSPSSALTLSQQRAAVDAHATLPAPVVSTSTVIDQSLLPADLASFVLPGATRTVVSRAAFVGGTSGYSITYSVAGNVLDVGTQFMQVSSSGSVAAQQPYAVLSGIGTSSVGMLEEQSTAYFVRVDVNAAATGGTKVTVTAAARK